LAKVVVKHWEVTEMTLQSLQMEGTDQFRWSLKNSIYFSAPLSNLANSIQFDFQILFQRFTR
jgi:hypothetical protein